MLCFAVEHVAHAGEAVINHDGGRDTVTGAHASEVEGFLDVSSSPTQLQRPDTCWAAVRERDAHPHFVEPGEARRSSHAAERGARSLGAAMRRPNVVRAERQ